MLSDTLLISFKAISNFTTCLGEVFSQDQKSLKLYVHLIKKTTLAHEKPIRKHIESFRKFCTSNREAILEKNHKKLADQNIVYSKRVYIDMNKIFKLADADTARIIWDHLLTISALVDPSGKAREILKKSSEKEGDEADFLSDIMNKVEGHVKPGDNPMDAISSIMKSDIFSDLVGNMGNGIQDGSLDLGKLMGTVQKMVSGLGSQMNNADGGGGGGGDNNPMGMLSEMMKNMGGNEGMMNQDGAPPDLSSMLGMMGPMLGTLAGGNGVGAPNTGGSIEAKIEAEVENAKKRGELNK